MKLIVKAGAGTIAITLLTYVLFGPGAAFAAPMISVTSGDDSGPGSLRHALESGATVIMISPSVETIDINSSLYYAGLEPLKIVGAGQVIDGGGARNTLLEITNGADLDISDLSFTDGGGFDVNNQGGGKGIFVRVPIERTGVVSLTLTNVVVYGVGHHGVHVLDCDQVGCGAGGGGGGNGSPASIHARVSNVTVIDVGNGAFDSDGIRIDDRGDGDIIFYAVNSQFLYVGADGVELDEGDNGDVVVEVRNSIFELNGGYCFGVDVNNPADPTCVENDAGNLVLDLDDGFDIDEAGSGSLVGSIQNIRIANNLDEGLDLDEQGEGGIDLYLVEIDAWSNGDEGIKLSEENGGDVVARLRAVSAVDNGDDGIQIEEVNDGDLTVTVNSTVTFENKVGKAGLKVEELDAGTGTLQVRGSDIDSIDTNVDEI